MAEPLNDEEFHRQALAGGASRHVPTGVVPSRGYMVGGARDLDNLPFAEQIHPVDRFSVDQVRAHARAIKQQFGEESSIHQGAWREGDNVVLDASENIPTYSKAITAAESRGERAIYDVKRGRDWNTKDARAIN